MSARMSGNRFTRTRPQRRNGKVKRSQTFFQAYSLFPRPQSPPSLVIPRVVFIRAPRSSNDRSVRRRRSALQSRRDNDSFGQGALSPVTSRPGESKTNRRDFAAVKPRDDTVFHDFQYMARPAIPCLGAISIPYLGGRNRNHPDRVCWATSLLYDATIPISRHKVVFFHSVVKANFQRSDCAAASAKVVIGKSRYYCLRVSYQPSSAFKCILTVLNVKVKLLITETHQFI